MSFSRDLYSFELTFCIMLNSSTAITPLSHGRYVFMAFQIREWRPHVWSLAAWVDSWKFSDWEVIGNGFVDHLYVTTPTPWTISTITLDQGLSHLACCGENRRLSFQVSLSKVKCRNHKVSVNFSFDDHMFLSVVLIIEPRTESIGWAFNLIHHDKYIIIFYVCS